MKLEKAIEIARDINNAQTSSKTWDSINAIKLLIEAGKRCKTLAENSPLWAANPLPGETKD